MTIPERMKMTYKIIMIKRMLNDYIKLEKVIHPNQVLRWVEELENIIKFTTKKKERHKSKTR